MSLDSPGPVSEVLGDCVCSKGRAWDFLVSLIFKCKIFSAREPQDTNSDICVGEDIAHCLHTTEESVAGSR